MRPDGITGLALAVVMLLATGSGAVPPRLINYQGILASSDGMPLNGSFELRFQIYEDSLTTAALWSETHADVPVQDGLFQVILGGPGPVPLTAELFEAAERWLGITVDGGPEEMSPRMRLTSVPWAFRAAKADTALTTVGVSGDGHSLDAADGSPEDVVYVADNGFVGIGTTNPTSILTIGGAYPTLYLHSSGGSGAFLALDTEVSLHPWVLGHHLHSEMLEWYHGETMVMHFDQTGYIGIGTATPSAKLDVNGIISSAQGYKFPDGSIQVTAAGGGYWTGSGNHIYNNNSGNVGVGITSPSAKLHVDGDLRLENGGAINEFSSDGTLSDESDLAVPTESAVKSYVDGTLGSAGVPIGSVVAWLKNFPATPALALSWVECNGQVLNDPQSPYHGRQLPNLNGEQRFLRGMGGSGSTGGAESHTHGLSLGPTVNAGTQYQVNAAGQTYGSSNIPPFYSVVWIMKVK